MKSRATKQKQMMFREVYIFDMEILQHIFSQNMRENPEDKMSFGMPFLLCEKGDKINSFASLILDSNNKIAFRIYNNGNLSDEDKAIFKDYIEKFLKKKRGGNFNNALQLKQSTEHFIHCLNF